MQLQTGTLTSFWLANRGPPHQSLPMTHAWFGHKRLLRLQRWRQNGLRIVKRYVVRRVLDARKITKRHHLIDESGKNDVISRRRHACLRNVFAIYLEGTLCPLRQGPTCCSAADASLPRTCASRPCRTVCAQTRHACAHFTDVVTQVWVCYMCVHS